MGSGKEFAKLREGCEKRWQKFSKVVKMLLFCVVSVWFGGIGQKLCMKTLYNSKIFADFVDFSYMILWAQIIFIHLDLNFSKPLDEKLPILLATSIYQDILYKVCINTWYISKSLWILSIFLVWCLGSKYFDTPNV